MRYRDAPHVDVGSFYARSPSEGKVFRILGHVGVAVFAAAAWRHEPLAVTVLLVALLGVWLIAWWRVVGTLWRSSIVAGIVACAVWLAADRCGACCHAADHAPRATVGP